MNRNATLIAFILIIVGGIFAFVFYKNKYFPKHNWMVDYRKSNDQPYGLKLFYSAIKEQKFKTTVIHSQTYYQLDSTIQNSNFIYIGNGLAWDSLSANYLLKYAERGNRVFISSNDCPLGIIKYFVPQADSIYNYKEQRDSVVTVSFKNDVPYQKKIKFHYQILKDTTARLWSIYRNHYFNDTLRKYGCIPISFLNDSCINSFYIPHGKGRIIVQANPILFTNFYMVNEKGFEHANHFLSQLHQGPTYWYDPLEESSKSETTHDNPLKFLFSHPYLKWAWYLFLITLVLYLIFRSKREQRIIPLMPVNANASIEYTKAIGTLYYQKKGHNPIANEMYLVFLSEIRSRYSIATDLAEPQLLEQLSASSGVNKTALYNLFKQFKYVRNDADANANDLISLYNQLETYYKKRK